MKIFVDAVCHENVNVCFKTPCVSPVARDVIIDSTEQSPFVFLPKPCTKDLARHTHTQDTSTHASCKPQGLMYREHSECILTLLIPCFFFKHTSGYLSHSHFHQNNIDLQTSPPSLQRQQMPCSFTATATHADQLYII